MPARYLSVHSCMPPSSWGPSHKMRAGAMPTSSWGPSQNMHANKQPETSIPLHTMLKAAGGLFLVQIKRHLCHFIRPAHP
eukprot:804681-Pelagomonas_calceolata.AAC.1